MSGEVQALFMVGAAGGEPPVTVCTPDPYYSCSASDTRTVLSIHADTNPPIDQSCYQTKTLTLTGSASVSAVESMFGGKSILVSNVGTSTLNGLVVTDHPDFDFGTGDFTIDLWAYRSAETYIGTLFYGTLGGDEFSVKVLTNQIYLVYRSSGGQQAFNSVATWPTGQWAYFVTQRRGTNWETYLNGALIHSAAITGGTSSTVNSSGDLYFGRTNVSSAQSWNGYLDDVRVTKGAARYTNPNLPIAAFPDGAEDPYWDDVILLLHGEGADGGTVFTDSSNYNRPMTTAGTPITTTEAKKFGNSSIKLYGNLTAVITNSDASLYLADNDFTIEFWIYYNVAVGSWNRRAFQADSSSTPPWDITCLSSTNAINITLRNGGSQFATVSTTALSVGQWYHVAFCRRNKTELYAFVNGVQAQYYTIASTLVSNNSSGIYVGNNLNNSDLAPRFYLDDIRITNGVARYPSAEGFVPPLLTFCESADPVVVNPLPGEEPLQGVSAACALGTVKVAGSSTSLTSVSVTGAVGSIVPIAAGAPFPNLIIATTNLSGWSRNAPVVVHTNVKKDGTVSWELYDGSTEAQPVLSGNIGLWIVNTDPNYPIETIIDRYTFSAFRNGEYGGSFSVVSSPDANTILRVVTSVSTEVNPILFDFEITVLPTNSNPRFGESGYYGRNRILYSLAQPAPVSPSAYPNLVSTTYGPSTFTASVPATAYLDFMADGRVLFFSLAANTIPDFEGRWIQTSTYYNTQDILSAYSFSSTHWNILTPGGGIWKRVRIDYGLNTTFVQTIVPNSTNPRYNEAGYIGTHTFTLQLVGLT